MEILVYLRQFKIGPFAIFDVVVSYLGIYLLAPLLTKLFAKLHLNIGRVQWLWLTLPIAAIFHLIFKQDTPLMKMVMDTNGYYFVKIAHIFMLFMGLRNIRSSKK